MRKSETSNSCWRGIVFGLGWIICSSPLVHSARADEARIFVSNEYFTFGAADDFTVAVKLADFDGDGDLDVLAANGRHWARADLVYLNNGNGRMLTARVLGNELATSYEPAVADMNGDGWPDIVVARDRVPGRLFLGNGHGMFDAERSVGLAGPTRSVATADMDGDGNPDLVFSLRGEQNLVTFGPGFDHLQRFGPAQGSVRLALGDFDNDGDIDAVFANLDGGGSTINRNDGNGGLDDTIELGPASGGAVDVDIGDLNGDGWPDIAFAGLSANVAFLNDGRGGFAKATAFGGEDERSYGIALGDLDGDGDVDIAVANDGEPNAVYFNLGGSFRRVVLADDPLARSYGVSIGDLNGDGFADLVFANSGAMSRIYLNAKKDTAARLLAR